MQGALKSLEGNHREALGLLLAAWETDPGNPAVRLEILEAAQLLALELAREGRSHEARALLGEVRAANQGPLPLLTGLLEEKEEGGV